MAGALALQDWYPCMLLALNSIMQFVYGNRSVFFILLIAELFLVGSLITLVSRLSCTAAMAIFIGYSVLNGLTFSGIFLIYTASSIGITFFITAGLFASMSVYGYTTSTDLTKFGNLLFMLLIGLVLLLLLTSF